MRFLSFLLIGTLALPIWGMNQRVFNKKIKQAYSATLKDNNRVAIRGYKSLLKRKLSFEQRNKALMGLARTYFQVPNLNKAIHYYSQVAEDSKYWLEAKEELAWSYLRRDQHDKAQSILRTLTSPVLEKKVKAEVYYLNSLSALKICDFKRVFKTSEQFKKVFKSKIPVLDKAKKYSALDSDEAQYLPYYISSDDKLSAKQKTRKLKLWARGEYKETKRIINLLKLAEAEAIQGIHLVNKNKRKTINSFDKVDGNEYLHFPSTENEFWIDEIDNYEVSVKDCPRMIGGRYAKN